jgi:uncharacterized Zn finger protein (UPF0148 family)
MASFRCRACGREGTFEYDGRHACPRCGSVDVQFALGIEEIPDDHPLIEALLKLGRLDHHETDED